MEKRCILGKKMGGSRVHTFEHDTWMLTKPPGKVNVLSASNLPPTAAAVAVNVPPAPTV
jgi:hypothetical protein